MKKIIKNRKIIAIINIIAVSIVFFAYNFSLRNNDSFALSRYNLSCSSK